MRSEDKILRWVTILLLALALIFHFNYPESQVDGQDLPLNAENTIQLKIVDKASFASSDSSEILLNENGETGSRMMQGPANFHGKRSFQGSFIPLKD